MVRKNHIDGTLEEKELQTYIGLIERGEIWWIKNAKRLLKKFPEYGNKLKDAIRTGKEKKLQEYIGSINRGNLYLVSKAEGLVEEFPNYIDELDEAIRTGEKIELQKYIDWIKERYLYLDEAGGIWFNWINEAEKLAKKYPEHKDELEEAIRISGEKRLPKYIHWIETGKLSERFLIDKIKNLVDEKFPEYKNELEKAIRTGKEKN